MNFENFKIVKTANERPSLKGVTREQHFSFRFRRFISNKNGKKAEEILFYFSNNLFKDLDLENKGLVQLTQEDKSKVFLALVDNDNATLLKRTEKEGENTTVKGKKFKSTKLEQACIEAGLIDASIMGDSQLLDLVTVAEDIDLGGIKAYKVLEVVKDTKEREEKAEEGDDDDDVQNDTDTVNADSQTGVQSPSGYSESVKTDDDF